MGHDWADGPPAHRRRSQPGPLAANRRTDGPATTAPPGPEEEPPAPLSAGPDVASRARKAALDFLSYRHRTAHEVRRHLESRFTGEVIDPVVQWLTERGFIDDAAFARDWRDRRERRRPCGEAQVRRELAQLGIAPDVVDQALQGYDAAANAQQAAQVWLAKQQHVKNGTDYAKLRRRIWGYLERRGFESELISQTVREVWEELPQPLDGGVYPED